MIALIAAYRMAFLRDRAGLLLTLLLPPLIYLLFAAIFGGSARGDIDASVAFANLARAPQSQAAATAVRQLFGKRIREAPDPGAAEREVLNGHADTALILRDRGGGRLAVEVLGTSGQEAAQAAVAARVSAAELKAAGLASGADTGVTLRLVGPSGNFQAVYYASSVSVMFVFFAAMHGAMSGLDERRSGLQSRLALAAGGLRPIMTARLVWLATVGVAQTAIVFLLALPRMPPPAAWQVGAALVTAATVGLAAAGFALLIVACCRTRDQAQPLSTFLVLLLAAMGGSMAPRFLMPDVFRTAGSLTPHAWAIDTYQALLWRGAFDRSVLLGWSLLTALGVGGALVALLIERRRLLH